MEGRKHGRMELKVQRGTVYKPFCCFGGFCGSKKDLYRGFWEGVERSVCRR